MKKYSLLLVCLTGIVASYAQNSFTVKVKINNPNHYTLFLGYFRDNKFVSDTACTTEDGWCVFRGSVKEPVVASFGVRNNPALTIKTDRGVLPGPSLSFVLSNDDIKIIGDANTVYASKVQGGKANSEWKPIKAKQSKLQGESWAMHKKTYALREANDTVAVRELTQKMQAVAKEDFELQKKFIAQNPNSIVSTYFLSNMVNTLSYDELKTAYAGLNESAKDNMYARRIAQKIDGLNATAIGKTAIPIDKKDMNGNAVNLQTLKGKYVLIDFWGSWCGPCRESHPHLKEVYSKYKDQGFEIVGVAQENYDKMEKNQKVWRDAIEKDGISWIQVLNNEGIEKFDAVKAYGVSAFPTKILLDKDGKVIDRYVGEEKERFDAKLKELFGN